MDCYRDITLPLPTLAPTPSPTPAPTPLPDEPLVVSSATRNFYISPDADIATAQSVDIDNGYTVTIEGFTRRESNYRGYVIRTAATIGRATVIGLQAGVTYRYALFSFMAEVPFKHVRQYCTLRVNGDIVLTDFSYTLGDSAVYISSVDANVDGKIVFQLEGSELRVISFVSVTRSLDTGRRLLTTSSMGGELILTPIPKSSMDRRLFATGGSLDCEEQYFQLFDDRWTVKTLFDVPNPVQMGTGHAGPPSDAVAWIRIDLQGYLVMKQHIIKTTLRAGRPTRIEAWSSMDWNQDFEFLGEHPLVTWNPWDAGHRQAQEMQFQTQVFTAVVPLLTMAARYVEIAIYGPSGSQYTGVSEYSVHGTALPELEEPPWERTGTILQSFDAGLNEYPSTKKTGWGGVTCSSWNRTWDEPLQMWVETGHCWKLFDGNIESSWESGLKYTGNHVPWNDPPWTGRPGRLPYTYTPYFRRKQTLLAVQRRSVGIREWESVVITGEYVEIDLGEEGNSPHLTQYSIHAHGHETFTVFTIVGRPRNCDGEAQGAWYEIDSGQFPAGDATRHYEIDPRVCPRPCAFQIIRLIVRSTFQGATDLGYYNAMVQEFTLRGYTGNGSSCPSVDDLPTQEWPTKYSSSDSQAINPMDAWRVFDKEVGFEHRYAWSDQSYYSGGVASLVSPWTEYYAGGVLERYHGAHVDLSLGKEAVITHFTVSGDPDSIGHGNPRDAALFGSSSVLLDGQWVLLDWQQGIDWGNSTGLPQRRTFVIGTRSSYRHLRYQVNKLYDSSHHLAIAGRDTVLWIRDALELL